MADLLAESAAFTNLLQAWQALEKRLPAEARRAFGRRLGNCLLDIAEAKTRRPGRIRRTTRWPLLWGVRSLPIGA